MYSRHVFNLLSTDSSRLSSNLSKELLSGAGVAIPSVMGVTETSSSGCNFGLEAWSLGSSVEWLFIYVVLGALWKGFS